MPWRRHPSGAEALADEIRAGLERVGHANLAYSTRYATGDDSGGPQQRGHGYATTPLVRATYSCGSSPRRGHSRGSRFVLGGWRADHHQRRGEYQLSRAFSLGARLLDGVAARLDAAATHLEKKGGDR